MGRMMQPNEAMTTGRLGSVSRRGFGAFCLGTMGALALPSSGQAAVMPVDRLFAVFRNDSEIGRHAVRFAAAAGGFTVTTDIDIAVKVAFITAFRFSQRASEHWADGLLVDSRATTDDNGQTSTTEIEARGSALRVEGGIGNRAMQVPLGTMTDIAFWNLDIVRQRELLDIQRAEMTAVAASHVASETVDLGGQPVSAERFTINSRSGRNGDIWFDAAGNWIKGHLITRGETLDYRLIV